MYKSLPMLLLLSLLASPAAAQLVDPMAPPGQDHSDSGSGKARPSAPPRELSYHLSATYIAAERRVAVINGRRVREGERIGGARVLEILPTQVRLQRSSGELIVRLMPVRVKKPAADEQEQQ